MHLTVKPRLEFTYAWIEVSSLPLGSHGAVAVDYVPTCLQFIYGYNTEDWTTLSEALYFQTLQ